MSAIRERGKEKESKTHCNGRTVDEMRSQIDIHTYTTDDRFYRRASKYSTICGLTIAIYVRHADIATLMV